MPKFHVKDTFAMESRSHFVLAGSIVEGQIRPGMLVWIPLNSAIVTTARINCMEYVRRSGGHEDTCLCISYTGTEDLEFWRGLNIGDETLEVMPDASGDAARQQAIEAAVQMFRFHPDAPEEEILNRLLERGMDRLVATQLIGLLPIAYGRVLLSDSRGVQFADTYIHPGDHRHAAREIRLDTLPLWTDAIRFARQDGEPFIAIASRSPEVRAVNAALLDGKQLESLLCSPPVFLWPEFPMPAGSGMVAEKSHGWRQIWQAPAEHPLSRGDLTVARVAMILAVLVGLVAVGVAGYYAFTLWQAVR